MTIDEWKQEAIRRFGTDPNRWRFVCPSCGHVASIQDWKDAGASEGEAAFSCIGRHISKSADIGGKPGPCNYAGGGLFQLNPITITHADGHTSNVFDFADADEVLK
jgi:hypothetical protein